MSYRTEANVPANLEQSLDSGRAALVEGDLRDRDLVRAVTSGASFSGMAEGLP